jgi:truncated hemoglobin YjbI
MAETATETATTPTEATTSEAAGTTLATATDTPATEQQQAPVDGTKPTTEEKPTETKPEGAPEKYDFKAPEGKEYDPAVLESFSAAAKEANLTQDAAQKLLEKVAPSLATRQQEQVDAIRNGWLESTKADKEFGGEKLQENLGVARKALESFGSPELRKLLDDTGMGNNPEVIRFMYRAGKAISEDGFVSGAPSSKNTPDPTSILYNNTKKE